jgi:hypothetical protein
MPDPPNKPTSWEHEFVGLGASSYMEFPPGRDVSSRGACAFDRGCSSALASTSGGALTAAAAAMRTSGSPHSCDEDHLPAVVAIQSLLAQFAHPQVRADFVQQRFGCHINANLLPRMDQLRWSLFPRWVGGSLELAKVKSQTAAGHLKKLITRDSELFILDSTFDGSPTYQRWCNTLETIAESSYRQRVPASKRCAHILRD